MNRDSVCVMCKWYMQEATIDGVRYEDECDLGNAENFGTPSGCCDYLREGMSAETKRVKRGFWVPGKDNSSFYCSACFQNVPLLFADELNYCPNCGANMNGLRK